MSNNSNTPNPNTPNSNTPNSNKPLKTIKSFVLRAGRTKPSQQDALAKLFPKYGLDHNCGHFGQNIKEHILQHPNTVIEIGFGMGDAFIEHASQNTKVNFIGIEVHPPGIGNALKKIDQLSLDNCKIIQYDAIQILENHIENNSLAGVQLFFPDPWPKKKHHKRRIVNTKFLELVSSKLKPSGYLYIATDWQPYAQEIHQLLEQSPNFTPANPKLLPITKRTESKFERRGLKLGHEIADFIYIKTPTPSA